MDYNTIDFSFDAFQNKNLGCRPFRVLSLFIYLLQFNDNKQHHHKDSLQKSLRPHTKADHLKQNITLNKKMIK